MTTRERHEFLLRMALQKAFNQKDVNKAKLAVGPGEFDFEANVRVKAQLKLGQPYEQVIATKVPWERLVAVALSKLNGVTLRALVREALAAEVDEDAIKDGAKEALVAIKGKATTTCLGKLSAPSVDVRLVSASCSTAQAVS